MREDKGHGRDSAFATGLIVIGADAEGHTGPERAAALNVAARIATEAGIVVTSWPAPPPGWAWQGGALVRAGPSTLPPLRVRPSSVDTGFFRVQQVAAVRRECNAPAPAPPKRSPKAGSKAATVLALIGRPQGADLDGLTAATGMTPVSLRATVSVYARDRAAFDPATRTYRLIAA